MTARRKLLLTIAVVLAGTMAILFVGVHVILAARLAGVEETSVRLDVQRALDALDAEVLSLEAVIGGYAVFDEAGAAGFGSGGDLLQRHFPDWKLASLRLNLVWLADSAGQPIFGTAFDLAREGPAPIPDALWPLLAAADGLPIPPTGFDSQSGIVLLPEGPMLIALRPVVVGGQRDPVGGTLVVGRYLDLAAVERRANNGQSSMALYRLDDPQLPADIRAAQSALSGAAPILVRATSQDTAAGYALLTDIYGVPALLLRLASPRTAYQEGQAQVRLLLWSILAVGLAVGGVAYFALDRMNLAWQRDGAAGAGYRALVEQIPAITYVAALDKAGSMLYVSPPIKAILGYSPDEWMSDPKLWLKRLHPDDRERVLIDNARRRASGERVCSQYRLIARDGRVVWVHDEGMAVTDNGHQPLFLQGVMLDITERKRAEEELRHSEEYLRSLIDSAPDAIVVVDGEGGILRVNARAEQMFGYNREELLGEPVGKLLVESVGPQPVEQPAAGAAEPRTRPMGVGRETRGRRRDGSEFPVVVNLNSLQTEGDSYVISVIRDITDHKQVEEALEESEARYRMLFEQANDAIFLETESGRIVDVNQRACDVLGYSRDEMLAMTVDDLKPPELRGRPGELLRDQLARHQGMPFETVDLHRTGARIPVEVTLTRVKGKESALILAVVRDIGERKQRLREIEAIVAVSAALRVAQTRAEMLPVLLDQLINLLEADGASLAMRDALSGETVIELGRGAQETMTGTRLPAGEGTTGRVITSGQPWPPAVEPPAAAHAESCAPLIAAQQAFGALWVVRRSPFTAAETRLLMAVANIAANAIHRATLHEQTRRRAEQLAAVNALGRALAEIVDLPQIYERLYEATLQLLPGTSAVYISRFDPERSLVSSTFAAVDGRRPDGSEPRPMPLQPPGKGIQSEVIHSCRPLIVNDLPERLAGAGAPDAHGIPGSARSGLYVPMLAKGRPIGLVQVQSLSPNRFTQSDAALLSLVANTAAIAIENASLFAASNRRIEYLQALQTVDLAITASLDLRVILNILLAELTTQLDVHAAAILLFNAHIQTLEFAAGRGFRSKAIERISLRPGEDHAGRVVLGQRPVHIPNLSEAPGFVRASLLAGEGFVAYYGVPLLAKGQTVGVLEIFHRAALHTEPEWRDFLEMLARQAAIAIENAQLISSLQRTNAELALAYDTTLEGWSQALDLRDEETEGHTQRVTEMTVRLARAMGVGEAELVHLRRGALLHDIGKMGIPDGILRKPGRLSDQEWEVMRRHPQYAYDLLSSIEYLRPALDIPYCHHEKWDGTGYPRGLKGEQIPLAARIFAVVDVYDALRSDRPYRAAWPQDQVCRYLRAQAGQHFDPELVVAFLRDVCRGD